MEGRALTLELLGTNELEIAYLAGLFDGEGCISVHTTRHRFTISLHLFTDLKMTTPDPLRFASRIFGGRVKPAFHRPNEQPMYRWSLYGSKSEAFLRAVDPYLIVKKEEANLAFSFLACRSGNSPRKLELAELITPHRTKNQPLNPNESTGNQR
ncbi:hypothetical protein ES705_48471 [subsurface metagenome]